jgi:UDP-GlcNAc:undecaprenyl-phosphate GlcNAc-1-phosphate transferase
MSGGGSVFRSPAGRFGAPLRLAHGRRGSLSALIGAGLAAAAARASYTAFVRRPPGGEATWTRTNHRGEPVTLLEGPAVATAAMVAAAISPGLAARTRAALVAAAIGAGAFGGYDDLAGSSDRRGFRGHLGALARGDVTTGAVKLGGIGATGLAAGALLGGSPLDVALNAGLTAGAANLLNLFDLRPGRAIKVAVAAGALLAVGAPGGTRGRAAPGADAVAAATPGSGRPAAAHAVAAPLGAALALLPEDLGERAMLGDAGANALGAMLGVAAAASLRRPARIALLAAITGLTAASEMVSFTKVIERTPPLHWLDMLGRRPAAPAPAAPASADTAQAAAEEGNGEGFRSGVPSWGEGQPEPAPRAATSGQ